ncbi:MAG: SGNH/GDSL hydrolase family protein [Marmoricola sp.]
MTSSRTRAAGMALVAALSLVLSGCGAGGFGGKEPANLDTSIKSYVALGDGFAAAPYVGRTTSKDGCLRSELNYPQQVATALGVTDFKDVSCLGATTKAITDSYRPPGAKRDVKAQLDAVTKDTELVTITVGLSDGNLLNSIFRICTAAPCGNEVIAKKVVDQLNQISTDLPATIRAVVAKAPQAYVVVVGYPELMPLENGCKTLPRMNDDQWSYANLAWDRFTTAVGSAARQAGATFVDVQRLSADHPPCSKHPWVSGGTSVKGKSVAYHPKPLEQQAVATAVADQVKTR